MDKRINGASLKERTDNFIKKSNIIHNNKYDYSKINYKNTATKVEIICPKHGSFWQKAGNHYSILKQGCPDCGGSKLLNTETFIEKAKKVHGNTYDYSKVNYINNNTIICIVCNEHGTFNQTPTSHLDAKCGCPKCAFNRPISFEEFVNSANNIHNNFYDYSFCDYKNMKTKVEIICPVHGSFKMKPIKHINEKQRCIKCIRANPKIRLSTEEFVENCIKTHGVFYDYSQTIFTKTKSFIKIICPKHGLFKQKAELHLRGCGCQKCGKLFSSGSRKIDRFLTKNKLIYDIEKSFPTCKFKNLLFFDFYIKDKNLLIEFDGKQHFEAVDWFGGNVGLQQCQKRDKIKNTWCIENNIKLLRIPYWEEDNIEIILSEELDLK